MTQLYAIGNTTERRARLIDVVFVHGAGGNYLESWGMRRKEHGGEMDSMLHWLLEDLENIGVWSVQHESDKTIFGKQGSLLRKEVAGNLFIRLSSHRDIRPGCASGAANSLWWVAHSDGGNIVKRLLKACQENSIGESDEAKTAKWILEATQKVFFIDTPHYGSWLANGVGRIPFARRIAELGTGDKELRDLTDWFFKHANNLGIDWLNFYETDQSRLKVVRTESARPYGGMDAISIDRNHNLIAKPSARDQDPYATIQEQICLLLGELRTPVAATAPQLHLHHDNNIAADDLCRLLIFVTPVQGHKSLKLLADRRYSLRCWFKRGASDEPRESSNFIGDTAGDGADLNCDSLGFDRLADVIAGAYIYELNQAEELDDINDSSLLSVLFLPEDLLVDQALMTLLANLDEVVHRRIGHCDYVGMPLLLACSSRWPVAADRHPLMDTQRFLKDASKRVVQHLWNDPNSKLAGLPWLFISEARFIADPNQRTLTDAAAFSSNAKTLDGQVFDRIIVGKAGESDRAVCDAAFQGRDALHFQWCEGQAASSQSDWQRFHRLLYAAKPVIWCDGACALSGSTSGLSGPEPVHPMEVILNLKGSDFLQAFHRSRGLKARPDDPHQPAIREYIRRSIVFWEDHRYLPPITPAARPLRSPFQ